jgi:ribulose 1,5-bisphosphate synthetase/thiazole synthase
MIDLRNSEDGTDEYDVVVAGGGTAGWAAGLAAARCGRRVLVVERKGYLGGTLGSGLPIHGFSNAGHQQVVSGIAEEFVRKMQKLNGSSDFIDTDLWFARYVLTNPAVAKACIIEMLYDAGVEVLLYSQIVDVVMDGTRIKSIVVQKKDGTEMIRGKVFIDASGDAVVCHHAGVQMQVIDTMQPPSLIFRIENVDIPELRDYLADHPEQYMDGRFLPGTELTSEFLKNATFFYVFQSQIGEVSTKGSYSPLINRFMFTTTPDNQGVVVNMLRAHNIDGKSSESLTTATVDLYRNLVPLVEYFRKSIPGFSRCTLCDSEPEVQLRETRRIEGEYSLQGEDVIEGKFFPDTIAVGGYFIDIHSSTDSSGIWKLLEKPYGIPYRALVPRGIDNLITAGRCISGTREAAASYRVMATCMAMGHAAGVAAAQAVSEQIPMRDIDTNALRSVLKEQKAVLEV